MNTDEGIKTAKEGFEAAFLDRYFYEKQTADASHLRLLMDMMGVKRNDTVLDLGTGTGYIAFSLAETHKTATVVGLDIVTETLKRNTIKTQNSNMYNLSFLSYDGYLFPFPDNHFDIIITRYALHHFPNIMQSFQEMYRVLKPNGKLIISDPTPNENDSCHFIDRFMQAKADGHIKFYRLNEFQKMLDEAGFQFISNQVTGIKFSRKGAEKYSEIIGQTDKDILSGYQIEIRGDEIWITETVLNMVFSK